jgi:chaperonin cofactor prefoldin
MIAAIRARVEVLQAEESAIKEELRLLDLSLRAAQGDAAAKSAAGGKAAAKAAAKVEGLRSAIKREETKVEWIKAELLAAIQAGDALWASLSEEERKSQGVEVVYNDYLNRED